ncbi:MAG: cyclopropane-fatty-acyl-phospholipid synthase family protein [Bauldia sp.]
MSLFPLDRILSRFVCHGQLTLVDTDGSSTVFGRRGDTPSVTIRLLDPTFRWRLLYWPGVAFGEGYMDRRFAIEEGTLRELLEIVMISQTDLIAHSRLYPFWRRIETVLRTNPFLTRLGKAERNVRHHYDIGHALYETFLDNDLQYSCALWSEGVSTLEEAQLEKKRLIARKLLLSPGMEVLDIGSGWGGLALYLAAEHRVRVTGVTLSKDQYETSLARAEAAGLSDRVTFKLLDYRLLGGEYDRIVSVGMFEHVGLPRYREFFAHLKRLLRSDGVALLHTIGKMQDPGPVNGWTTRYIFPGGYLPTLSEIAPATERNGLWLTDIEVLRLHYAKTLRAWDGRFQARRKEVAAMFDERFCRMWEFYLQAAEMSFRCQELCNFQIQIAKRIDAVPLTRDYLLPLPARSPARIAVGSVARRRPRKNAPIAAE